MLSVGPGLYLLLATFSIRYGLHGFCESRRNIASTYQTWRNHTDICQHRRTLANMRRKHIDGVATALMKGCMCNPLAARAPPRDAKASQVRSCEQGLSDGCPAAFARDPITVRGASFHRWDRRDPQREWQHRWLTGVVRCGGQGVGDAPPLAIETDDQEPARTETRGDDDQALNRLARFVAKAAAGHSLERHN